MEMRLIDGIQIMKNCYPKRTVNVSAEDRTEGTSQLGKKSKREGVEGWSAMPAGEKQGDRSHVVPGTALTY